jgi:hypothetical protein
MIMALEQNQIQDLPSPTPHVADPDRLHWLTGRVICIDGRSYLVKTPRRGKVILHDKMADRALVLAAGELKKLWLENRLSLEAEAKTFLAVAPCCYTDRTQLDMLTDLGRPCLTVVRNRVTKAIAGVYIEFTH